MNRDPRPLVARTYVATVVANHPDHYRQHEDGSVRRVTPKVRGKAARRAEKKARHK